MRSFFIPFLLGAVCSHLQTTYLPHAPHLKTQTRSRLFHMSSLGQTGVSHNPDIMKRVLVGYFDVPHVTQIAKAELRQGQVASENWHRDMAEVFIFVGGEGVLELDGRNYSVGEGWVAVVMPPTKHTIYNTGKGGNLELFSIAAVP